MPLNQEHLDGLATFVAVAQLRGFSTAAVKLGMSPSAVSQTIQKLEARLGTPLFARTTRSVNLTEAGERYLSRVAPAVDELSLAAEELSDEGARPAGLLRLNVARAAFLFALRPVLPAFHLAYPDVELEISVDSSLVDIVRLGFDAGIRYADMVERDMVGVPVGPPLSSYVVAAPDYLKRRGVPQQPRDLLTHDCIRFRYPSSGRIQSWLFERGKNRSEIAVSGSLVLNDDAAMVEAALAGLGVAYLTSGYVAEHLATGRLVRLLAAYSPEMPRLSLYYPSRRRMSRKLRVLIDFLREASNGVRTSEKARHRPGRRAARR
ncbi:MAG TPA: LysR family transcriptional regulator [Polyangiaceae bacterium]|nr:LysR family transcriptional regulator [Polyangiaceae bacterium]